MNEWVIWLGGVAAAVTSISVIWHRALLPGIATTKRIWKALRRMTDAWDVLYEISEQFKPNGGSTLHDRITLLELGQSEMQRQLERALSFHPADTDTPDIDGTPV